MKLSKISLNHLSKAEMEKKEQNMLRGGANGRCACAGSCGCTGYVVGDNYYDSSTTNMIGLDYDEVGIIAVENSEPSYSYSYS